MYVKRLLFHYRGFASSLSLESSRIDWTCALWNGFSVHRGPLGRRLVRIASMECCPVRGSGSGPPESALSIAAPRQRALYPILPFSTLT